MSGLLCRCGLMCNANLRVCVCVCVHACAWGYTSLHACVHVCLCDVRDHEPLFTNMCKYVCVNARIASSRISGCTRMRARTHTYTHARTHTHTHTHTLQCKCACMLANGSPDAFHVCTVNCMEHVRTHVCAREQSGRIRAPTENFDEPPPPEDPYAYAGASAGYYDPAMFVQPGSARY